MREAIIRRSSRPTCSPGIPSSAELGVQTLRLEAVGEDGGLGMRLEQAGDPPRLLQDRALTIDREVYEASRSCRGRT